MGRIGRLILVTLLVGLLPACQNLDEMTRPRAVYQAFTTADYYAEEITPGLALEVRCIERLKTKSGAAAEKIEDSRNGPCGYKVVNEASATVSREKSAQEIPSPLLNVSREVSPRPAVSVVPTTASLASYFSRCGDAPGELNPPRCAVARNRVVDLLKRIADENCATFLQTTFLVKSTTDSAHRFARDVLTGSTAAFAPASPPTAIGLSFANMLVGSYESVNSTFFLSEAFQSIETAINLERRERLGELSKGCSVSDSYDACTIHEAMRRVRQYEDACSLRSGLNKLQTLVHRQGDEERARLENESIQLRAQLKELTEQNVALAQKKREDALWRIQIDDAAAVNEELTKELKGSE